MKRENNLAQIDFDQSWIHFIARGCNGEYSNRISFIVVPITGSDILYLFIGDSNHILAEIKVTGGFSMNYLENFSITFIKVHLNLVDVDKSPE